MLRDQLVVPPYLTQDSESRVLLTIFSKIPGLFGATPLRNQECLDLHLTHLTQLPCENSHWPGPQEMSPQRIIAPKKNLPKLAQLGSEHLS